MQEGNRAQNESDSFGCFLSRHLAKLHGGGGGGERKKRVFPTISCANASQTLRDLQHQLTSVWLGAA